MIRFSDIHVVYRSSGQEVRALAGFDLELREGEMLAVLGANGSGKSTLARLSDGLLQPDAGTVEVDGIDTRDPARAYQVRSSVGLVMQNPDDQIVATNVTEEVAFGPENLGLPREKLRERVAWALEAVGLTGFEDREPHTLSGGQKQRLTIAGAIAMRPRYLVLDEPTSMLDPRGRLQVLAAIDRLRAEGVAVLVVTHRVEDVASADRVAVLSHGTLVWTGSFVELLSQPERLADWGLEPPPTSLLAAALRAGGADVPLAAVEPSQVVEALCR